MNNDAIDRIFNAADSCSPDDLRGPICEELERKDVAWARLVKAEIDVADCVRGEIPGARAEQRAARQALRALGVGVDALLGQ